MSHKPYTPDYEILFDVAKEQESFEVYAASRLMHKSKLQKTKSGEYVWLQASLAWGAWQGRAQIACFESQAAEAETP